MASVRDRYATQQKASDTQYCRAVRAYARGLSPQQAITCEDNTHRPQLSPPTIYRLYGQLRLRLCQVGYYNLTPPDPAAETSDLDGEPLTSGPHNLSRMGYWQLAEQMVRHRRGVSKENQLYHQAEIYHRLVTSDRTEREVASDIENIVKITGPLNQPPRNIEKARHFLFVRSYMRRIGAIRKMQFSDPDLQGYAQAILQLWIDRLAKLCDEKRPGRKLEGPGRG